MKEDQRYFRNGAEVTLEAFTVSGLDIGLLRGVNAFETARTTTAVCSVPKDMPDG